MKYITNIEKGKKKIDQYIKTFEDFSIKTIPDELIYISDIVRKDLIQNGDKSFHKLYNIGPYNFELNLIFNNSNKNEYKSEIDVLSILLQLKNDMFSKIEIPLEINSNEIDINKTISIITHELRHILDILSDSENDFETVDFMKKESLEQFRNTKYWNFAFQIYLTLEHELIARNNMIYTSIRWCGEKDKNKIIEKYKQMYSYTSLIDIMNFNHISFIQKFKQDELLKYTNIFIKDVLKQTDFCNDYNDLIDFYKKYQQFFIDKANEYLNYALTEIDRVCDDIVQDKIYENIKYFKH